MIPHNTREQVGYELIDPLEQTGADIPDQVSVALLRLVSTFHFCPSLIALLRMECQNTGGGCKLIKAPPSLKKIEGGFVLLRQRKKLTQTNMISKRDKLEIRMYAERERAPLSVGLRLIPCFVPCVQKRVTFLGIQVPLDLLCRSFLAGKKSPETM